MVAGDFDLDKSDIDLLAIVEGDIDDTALVVLGEMHDAFIRSYPEWEDRIEVAYVSVDAMRDFKTHPSRIARISPGEPLHFREMDSQWLMDWYQVQEQDVTVLGPPLYRISHIYRPKSSLSRSRTACQIGESP